MTTKIIIKAGKHLIRLNDIITLEESCKNLPETDYQLSKTHIYQKLFLHACKYGTTEIIIWFIQLYYELFGDIQRIALRQLFIYGKHVSLKNRMIETNWYKEYILPIMRI